MAGPPDYGAGTGSAEYLAGLPPFDRLDLELVWRVAATVSLRRFEPQEWLVRQGAPSDGSLLVLTNGTAAIVTESDGEARAVGACGPGDLAGVTGAVTGEPHPVGIQAETVVEALCVPHQALDWCLANPAFAAFFSRTLAQRLHRIYGELTPDHGYVDTQPFRKRVQEYLSGPPVTCSPDMPASDAARLTRAHGVDAVVVVSGGTAIGLVTLTDLVEKVLAEERPAGIPVRAIMSTELETIVPEAYSYEAMLRMVRRGFRHLPVIDDNGDVHGVISLSDLAQARGEGALALIYEIEHAESVPEVAAAVANLDNLLRTMFMDGVPLPQMLPVLSELQDRLTRRLTDLAIERLGPPPCDWCWISLGSAGREEQFTRSDQDNAIIYDGERNVADAYFADLAAFVVDGLERCGYARCPGDVMATNTAWRRSLYEWQLQVISMVSHPVPEQVRMATIFLDFRPVAGNRMLAKALRDQLWLAVESMPIFLYHLVRDDLATGVPIGPFRTLRTPLWGEHRGQINLKTEACVHVVDLLRVLALQRHVTETSTLGRLKALRTLGVLAKDDADWLEAAYQTLMRLRIQAAVRAREAGLPPVNHIQLADLTRPEQAGLKDALVAVARLQETVGAVLGPGGAL